MHEDYDLTALHETEMQRRALYTTHGLCVLRGGLLTGERIVIGAGSSALLDRIDVFL